MSQTKLKDLWKLKKKPSLSFEFFPTHDEKAGTKLEKAIDELLLLEPDFVSVTFGAGGSTREGSLALAKFLKQEKKQEVLPYLAAYGLNPETICEILDSHQQLGIDSVLCVRGDKPEMEDFIPHPHSFSHASDLLQFVKNHYHFFTGVAGYPEGHREAVSKEKDLEFLLHKVDQGAGFIITQYVYDNEYYFDFIERCLGIGINVPIVAGVMPIYSNKMTENLASICGATIPTKLKTRLAQLPPDDKDAVTHFGIEFAYQQCRELLEQGIDGLHFYTMDRSKSVTTIVQRLRKEGLL